MTDQERLPPSSPTIVFDRRSARCIPVLYFILACLLVGGVQTVLYHFTTDDSYITFRYVNNFVDGFGLVYNHGEKIEGFSNPLFILILSGLCRWVLNDVVFWAKFVGLIASAGTLASCYWLIPRTAKYALPAYFLILCMIVASPPFHVYAASGMETPLFAFLITLSTASSLRLQGRRSSIIVPPLLFGLTALCRPEAPLYSALWYALTALFDHPKNNSQVSICAFHFVRALLLAIPFAAYEMFRIHYYNGLLPNTFYAKPPGTFGNRASAFEVLDYFLPWIVAASPVLFGVALGVAWRRRAGTIAFGPQSIRILLHSAGPLAASVIFMVYTRGDWFLFGRFLTPIWPLVVATLVVLFFESIERAPGLESLRPSSGTIAVLAVVCAAASLGAWARDIDRYVHGYSLGFLMRGSDQVRAGAWLAQAFPGSLDVAIARIGGVGFVARQHIIRDMLGLVDREQARMISSGRRLPFGDSPIGRGHLDIIAVTPLNKWDGLAEYGTDVISYLRTNKFVCLKRIDQWPNGSMDFWVRPELSAGKMRECVLNTD